jgi:hypothetical protein
MAHFAQLNEKNVVVQVIVVSNNEMLDNGIESEAKGVTFCQSLFPNTNWKQTSYNNTIRKNYASIGYTYDTQRDAFIPPQPFVSWVLNEETCHWNPPIPYPNDDQKYVWNESIVNWEKI